MVLTVWTRRARAAFIPPRVRRVRAYGPRPGRVRGRSPYERPRVRNAVHQHIGPGAPIGSRRPHGFGHPAVRIASPALSRGQLSGTGTGAGAWVAVAPPTALLYSLRVLNALVNARPDQR